MGKFLTSEKQRQAELKLNSTYFSDPARYDGFYKKKAYPFCLPKEYSDENLFPEIRQSAIDYFSKLGIKWHDGHDGKPSNHLCDSQVCCVNFLFPLADKPKELAMILRSVFPDLKEMLLVEKGKYVSFEWFGEQNYLGERAPKNGKRTRGANATSADAIVYFERKDRKRHAVLIEWKYTESYSSTSLKFSSSGTDRTEIYRHIYERSDCPLNKDLLPGFDSLFSEPFYQLMRQQFLAHEMEKARELDADVVSLLHIAPAHNLDFRKVTSLELRNLGGTVIDIWKKIVKPTGRFFSYGTEQIFGNINMEELPTIKSWLNYIYLRYAWIKDRKMRKVY